MLSNLLQNLSASPAKIVFLLATVLVAILAGRKLLEAQRLYGTTRFANPVLKWMAGAAVVLLVLQGILYSRPYSPPPTGQIAIVLGPTQNSPRPTLSSDVAALVEATMLQHKGKEAEEFLDSIVFVSAAGSPEVVPMDAEALPFVDMSVNATRAKRDAQKNMDIIQGQLDELRPSDNGVDYLEAIFIAKQNVDPGTNLVVVGSGLSDSGELDFAHGRLLVDEAARNAAVKQLANSDRSSYLADHAITFSGLGDTVAPQEPLTSRQKDVVRDLYTQAIRALGGEAHADTKSRTGEAVATRYTVNTTDTGCGNVRLRFGDESIKFVSDQAVFADPTKARKALQQVVDTYADDRDGIRSITIDGYIAHVKANDPTVLSLARANAVRDALVKEGVPTSLIRTEGKGFGPYNDETKDRMVRITIERKNNPDC